jgi:hypothetical protein
MNAQLNSNENQPISTNSKKLRGQNAPLYNKYTSQTNPQPAYITIYPDGYRAVADWSGIVGPGQSMESWLGHEITIDVNESAKGDAIADMLESETFQTLAERICDGHSIVWDGNNHVGRLTDDAQEAKDELEEFVSKELEGEEAEIWEIGEWMDGITYYDNGNYSIQEIGDITAKTTDEELEAMEEKIQSMADDGNVEISDSISDWLESLRKNCTPADEDEE